MIIVELFCGTKSFSKVAEERGHKCFTIDINSKVKPDLCFDDRYRIPPKMCEDIIKCCEKIVNGESN